MKYKNNQGLVHIFSQFGKNIVIVSVATFFIHFTVKMISLAIIGKDFIENFNSRVFLQVFSLQMLPNLIVFAFLVSAVYYLFIKTRKMIIQLNENEIKVEKEQAVIRTMHKMTGLMAEFISVNNAEIKDWIEVKRRKGQKPPLKVINANEKISKVLEAMTKVSFVLPYIDLENNNLDYYVDYMEKNLAQVSSENNQTLQIPETLRVSGE